ncbi:E3 ubiquitin-protein ligase RING1 [Hordeum vulgare]|nr:E3 ubiquitin-protein ligase RING1 [Hordeum vulgare]
MPPPPEDHPLPRPKPKPPKHKHKPKPKPAGTMKPEPVRDAAHPFPPDPFACAAHCSEPCAYHRLCAPSPPSRTATVHLRPSSRLPTPLIALSASVLAVSVLLLLVLLVCHIVRRRRRQGANVEPLHHQVVEQGLPVGMVVPAPAGDGSDDGVHHVWYIRTVGLDERAIAAITALVYDPDKCRALGLGGDGCAVCLAEFRGGETLRLLPRCGHAFHRGCIDTWLRAHVNCPLCRAPVKVTDGATPGDNVSSPVAAAAAGAEEAVGDGVLSTEMAVRRAASMVALPRLPWPDVSRRPLASNSAREGEMGLAKISRGLKSWEALEMAGVGVGRSASFGAAPPRLPGRSGQPATSINADEIPR